MITRLRMKPISALLCASLCLGTAALAQDATTAPKKAATSSSGEDQYPDLVEIDPFGGISIYGQVNQGLTPHLVDGGVGGLRIAVNPTKYIGLELWADYAQANVEFKTSPGVFPAGSAYGVPGSPVAPYSFGSRNFLFGLNPVFNLRPRGSKVIPYLTVGVMGVQYTPTKQAKALGQQPINSAIYGSQNLNDNLQVGLNYGGGVKFHLTDHFGLRADVRGLWTRNPTYGLPSYANGTNLYIPSKNKLEGMQATLGLVIFLGQSKCPDQPPPPPPPAPLPTPTLSGVDSGTLCPGKSVTVHASESAPSGHTLTYAWTVNGQAQSATGADLTYTPTASGTVNVQVTVTDTTPPPPPQEKPAKFPVRCWVQPPAPQPVAPVTASTSFTVASDAPPTISSVSAASSTLACSANNGAHNTTLSSSAQGSACGGNLTYKWTVSEGTLTNESSPSPSFDASSIAFEGGAQGQSKTVTATLTVTDQAGKTATQNTTITVTCQPTFVRLDDVIFAKNNSRVNNCGKRVLIEDLAPKLSSGEYDVVLVGHRDTDEAATAPKGRKVRKGATTGQTLEQERVLNAAAVLSGGTGTCGQVDPSRIKVDYVGTDQTSESKLGQCGTSNTKERKGSETSEADKNRRVEVYLIPHGSTNSLPPAVKNLQPLPDKEVKALGCPK